MAKRHVAKAPKRVSWKLADADAAMNVILNAVKPIRDAESIPLAHAHDRVLANNVKSPLTLPAVNTSERDGYAVRAPDCAEPGATLEIIGEATAGGPFDDRLRKGTCVRIATGAVLPPGADAVVMFEDVEDAGDGKVTVGFAVDAWEWVARKGSDLTKGRVIFESGDVLLSPQIAALGAMGLGEIEVLRKPRAIVFTTGNEVQAPGTELKPGHVYDGNTAALAALASTHGVDAKTKRTVRDTFAALTKALADSAERYDLVIFTGGTSVGDKDFGRRALDELGKTQIHGVAIKPGKPLLFGTIGSTPILGLPGYPTSAMMLALEFLVPICLKLSGYREPIQPTVEAPLAGPVNPVAGKTSLLPVTIDERGRARVTFKGSAAISSIAYATGYLVLPPGDEPADEGSAVDIRLV